MGLISVKGDLCLLDESWWHVPFHDLVLCGLYRLLPHLENTKSSSPTGFRERSCVAGRGLLVFIDLQFPSPYTT